MELLDPHLKDLRACHSVGTMASATMRKNKKLQHDRLTDSKEAKGLCCELYFINSDDL